MSRDLAADARRLSAVSPEAARLYDRRKELLISFVNDRLSGFSDIDELIGHNPLSMMEDNHTNHALFMASVFRMNDFALLGRIIPWVYHAYNSHGFDYEYFPRELSAWREAVRQHLPESAAAEITPVYDWMLRHHGAAVALSQQPEFSRLPEAELWHDDAQPFLETLLAGERHKCMEFVQGYVRSADDLPALYSQVITPALYRIGALWEANEISVAQEHLATSLVSRIMATLYEKIPPANDGKGTALITSGPNERHQVGARMVADLLELDGWEVTYLGADTPARDVVACAADRRVQMVGISMAMPFNLEAVTELVQQLRGEGSLRDTRIMVGGFAFRLIPDLWKSTGADGSAPDASAAISLAQGWFN